MSVIDDNLIGGGVFEGKFLIATPSHTDGSCFDKSVIYVCAHSTEGAMGVIINQPMPMVEFDDLLDQLRLPQSQIQIRPDVLFGGPVETMRGFVLHSTDYEHSTSVQITPQLALNATIDILEDIAVGAGPQKSIFTLGYAGWGPGQLEQEVQDNSWLISDMHQDILFASDINDKWGQALTKIGVSPEHLTAFSGRA